MDRGAHRLKLVVGGVGYRGFVIRLKREGEMSSDLRVGFGRIESKERAWADPGRNLERWLLETGRAVIGDGLASTLAGEIDVRSISATISESTVGQKKKGRPDPAWTTKFAPPQRTETFVAVP